MARAGTDQQSRRVTRAGLDSECGHLRGERALLQRGGHLSCAAGSRAQAASTGHRRALVDAGAPDQQRRPSWDAGESLLRGRLRERQPSLGTLEDFVALIGAVHAEGMRLILDWVPNHTGWGHPWLREHPDWYLRDNRGQVLAPINRETGESWNWPDVAQLDYDNRELRQATIQALSWWVAQTGVGGFRMDAAHGVPRDFRRDAAPLCASYVPSSCLPRRRLRPWSTTAALPPTTLGR